MFENRLSSSSSQSEQRSCHSFLTVKHIVIDICSDAVRHIRDIAKFIHSKNFFSKIFSVLNVNSISSLNQMQIT